MTNYPIRVPAIRVQQPLGIFYAAAIPVEVLLQTTYSEKVRAIRVSDETYEVDGGQRLQKPSRLDEIAKYINREDSNFPNSIILAANYRKDGQIQGDDPDESIELREEPLRWRIISEKHEQNEPGEKATRFLLEIPSDAQLAAVIDGQHRLYAFAKAQKKHLRDEMLCAVFIDLPKPLQAQIFAIINSTQKPVSKSLTYELFGYNVDDEDEKYWSPDKLAVFFTRRLAITDQSPLKDRIIVAPENSFASAAALSNEPWKVSFATIVTGIVRLISSNPKADANLLMTPRRDRIAGPGTRQDKSVLREYYLQGNDQFIYDVIRNYSEACNQIFWREASSESYIRKTVGVQALFDVLRDLVREGLKQADLTSDFFKQRLSAAKEIDFANPRFRNPSGSGRSFIRRLLHTLMNISNVKLFAREELELLINEIKPTPGNMDIQQIEAHKMQS